MKHQGIKAVTKGLECYKVKGRFKPLREIVLKHSLYFITLKFHLILLDNKDSQKKKGSGETEIKYT